VISRRAFLGTLAAGDLLAALLAAEAIVTEAQATEAFLLVRLLCGGEEQGYPFGAEISTFV
jgi:hypothetical protein